MDPGTCTTRREVELAKVCECGHVRGVHGKKKTPMHWPIDEDGSHSPRCTKCDCVRFREQAEAGK